MPMPVISALDFTGDNMVEEGVPYHTPMRDFFRDKVVFLTGGTGFLGQLYVEKLLRCKVKKIYIMARSKKQKSALERLQETYTGAHFIKLAKIDPNYFDRIQIIEGNTGIIDLGISPQDHEELINNVEIVLHAAADVRFDNPLLELCLVNIRGTRDMLKLAKKMKNLLVFTYISTAYSHCTKKFVEEKFYEAPFDPDKMIQIAEYFENADKNVLEILTDNFTYPWPNTYTFSKALSEELVRRSGHSIPAVIVRPGSVISTHEDPIAGWSNNIYGVNGVVLACGLGFLRIMPFDRDMQSAFVCADFVINATLAVIWNKCSERTELLKTNNEILVYQKEEPTTIYQVTGKVNDVTWGKFNDTLKDLFLQYPAQSSIWLTRVNSIKCTFLEIIFTILYHAIPGFFMDIFLLIRKDDRRFLPSYRKTQQFLQKIRYFMRKQWTFSNANLNSVISKMSKHDKEYFPSDVNRYSWEDYSYSYMWGIRTYIGKEPLDNLVAGRKKLVRLKVAHYSVLVVYYALLAFVYYQLFNLFGLTDLLKKYYYSFISNF